LFDIIIIQMNFNNFVKKKTIYVIVYQF